MKNPRINRDQLQQNALKKELKKESVQIYGEEICFASKKPYKGLIASHIKSYKICVLEGDHDAEYDIDNSILLCKAIDDYFDKYLLTFGTDGKMIFSEMIPDPIKEEFAGYCLDERVFNEKRKAYMQIHRAIFFFKNYCQNDSISSRQIDAISVPYFDCGIKVIDNNLIIKTNNIWELKSIAKLKTVFTERTGFRTKVAVTSTELFGIIMKEPNYIIDNIPYGFNTQNKTIDLDDITIPLMENQFKISQSNYDVIPECPIGFYQIFMELFQNNDRMIDLLRYVLSVAFYGKGYDKSLVFTGDSIGIMILLEIIKGVFGSYVYEMPNPNIITSIKQEDYSIPNCRLLVIKPKNKMIPKDAQIRILNNKYFTKTILNIDRYVPVYISPNKSINESIVFDIKRPLSEYNLSELMKKEGGMLLWWILIGRTEFSESILDGIIHKHIDYAEDQYIEVWIREKCQLTGDLDNKVMATELYENYKSFCIDNKRTPKTMKGFCLDISKYLSKKRTGAGIYYLGICLKA